MYNVEAPSLVDDEASLSAEWHGCCATSGRLPTEIPCALAYQILSSSITHTPNTVVEAIQIYIFQVELIHKKILSHTATTLEKYDSKIH